MDEHVRAHVGKQQAEWLRNFSEAKSSDFSLRESNGREILGKVLQDNTIPEQAIRDLLQARSFCFPTAAVVSRNHGGHWDTKCRLCNAAVDTYAHRMMQCPHLHGAQHTMHDAIAQVLIQHLTDTLASQGPLPLTMEVYVAKRVDAIWPDCPKGIADFAPDGIIISDRQGAGKQPPRVIVFEFARSYTIEEDELLSVGAAKRNQYQSLVQYLRPQYPGHKVCCLSYIMSTLGIFPQHQWVQNCESIGYTAPQIVKFQMTGIRECIMAGHQLNNTARSQFEALRATGEPGLRRPSGFPRTGTG